MTKEQEILKQISKHWAEGADGNFSPTWDENDAASGYWLPYDDAQAIIRALAELQIVLNPLTKVEGQEIERLRTALRNVRGYIKDCDHEPALDEIDAALKEKP
jgi:hypothetical protein